MFGNSKKNEIESIHSRTDQYGTATAAAAVAGRLSSQTCVSVSAGVIVREDITSTYSTVIRRAASSVGVVGAVWCLVQYRWPLRDCIRGTADAARLLSYSRMSPFTPKSPEAPLPPPLPVSRPRLFTLDVGQGYNWIVPHMSRGFSGNFVS
ncbi:hypothetical protein J6590_025420 [Homalodisca vitripennis]|nr:hypothetical protein J6590_025420 [Homalodisca vitripennis]